MLVHTLKSERECVSVHRGECGDMLLDILVNGKVSADILKVSTHSGCEHVLVSNRLKETY